MVPTRHVSSESKASTLGSAEPGPLDCEAIDEPSAAQHVKIAPASGLAAWAVGTAWLILYVVLEKFDDPGPDALDWVQGIGALVALACFPLFRKWFANWLDRRH